MIHGQCPVCKADTTSARSYRVQFLYSTKQKKDVKITLFKSTVKMILRKETIVNKGTLKDDLISEIVSDLPIKINSSVSAGNSLYNIQ